MARMLTAALVALLLISQLAAANKPDKLLGGKGGKIKMRGKSGWINFCPAEASDDVTDGEDDSCITMRPFRFQEVDSTGSAVSASTSGKGTKKRVNNLYSLLTVGTEETGTLEPNCTKSAPYPCAWIEGNTSQGIAYTALPLTIDLATDFNSGTIRLTLIIMNENGTMKWDNQEVAVTTGTMKFNVQFRDYAFLDSANSAQFEVISKKRGKPDNSTRSNKLGGKTAAGLINFPRFVATSNNDEWKDASVETWSAGSVTGLRYSFSGNFTSAYYDPITDNSEESSAASSSTDAASADGASAVSVFAGAVLTLFTAALAF